MRPIGVYRTDVDDPAVAECILDVLQKRFPAWEASMDLDDCDRVLRVESSNGAIEDDKIRNVLQRFGHRMEVLP